MGGQPGKPKPPGNPPTRPEPLWPQPIEEPPRPLPMPPIERPPLQFGRSNLTATSLGNANGYLLAKAYPQEATYVRRRQSATWSKSPTKHRFWDGAFAALEPRAANQSKSRFAKSGGRQERTANLLSLHIFEREQLWPSADGSYTAVQTETGGFSFMMRLLRDHWSGTNPMPHREEKRPIWRSARF